MNIPSNDSRRARGAAPALGVDIGRVLIAGDGPDTHFIGSSDEDAMRAPAVEGAVAALARLVALYAGRVWLVSKCGPRVQDRTRRWLLRHGIYTHTGLRPDRVRYCRERADKAPICASLGITCFIDDREDVLAHMAAVVPTRILFAAAAARDPRVLPAPNWTHTERLARAARNVST